MYYVVEDVLEYDKMSYKNSDSLIIRSISMNLESDIIELTNDYPHYNKGLRGIEIESDFIILYVDLSFLKYCDICLRDAHYILVVISNENNLSLDFLNNKNEKFYDLYFQIDVSNSDLKFSTYFFNKNELINWRSSGLNLVLDGYDLNYLESISNMEDAVRVAEEFNLNILDNLSSSNCRLSLFKNGVININYSLTFYDNNVLLTFLSTLKSLLKESYSVQFKSINLSMAFTVYFKTNYSSFYFLNEDLKDLFDNFNLTFHDVVY